MENKAGELMRTYSLIEAVKIRNESQLMSFLDERDQWEAQSQEDRDLLDSEEGVEREIEVLQAALNRVARK